VRRARSVAVVFALVATSAVVPASAQTLELTYSLFERYLESYREQYAIPAISVALVQRGTVVWDQGLGKPDIDASASATADTPYYIGNLSQIFGATLVLRKCFDQSTLELSDRVVRWVPTYSEQDTTVGELLSHRSPNGTFAYDPARFSSVTGVVEECADLSYRHVLAGEIFDRLVMARSVPGRQLAGVALPGLESFAPDTLARYNQVINETARSYRLDRGRPVRSTLPVVAADAATGSISTVRDLAAFDRALRNGVLLTNEALTSAWTQKPSASGAPMPTGLGWFVQNYNGEPLIWQFDSTRDAGSSMVVRLPARDVTLILLANSDGLTAPFGLAAGDATTSPFVRLFLRFFAP
jgi:CubicO group peptidase (beta-lactamase class C family)